MREEDIELLSRLKEVEDFEYLKELFEKDGIAYDEIDLAKQYEMIHSPFAEIEPEN